MLAKDSCGLEVFTVHRGRVEKEAEVSRAMVKVRVVENEDGDPCGCTGWAGRAVFLLHSSGDSDKWGGCLAVPSAHGDVVPAKSCPHHLSPCFGPLELKAALCVL